MTQILKVSKKHARHHRWLILKFKVSAEAIMMLISRLLSQRSSLRNRGTATTKLRVFLVRCTMHPAEPPRHQPVLFSRRRKTLSKQLNCSQMDNSPFKHERNFNVTPSPWNLLQQNLQDSYVKTRSYIISITILKHLLQALCKGDYVTEVKGT